MTAVLQRSILSFLPLNVSRDLSVHLYSTLLNETPMFNNLSESLVLQLCQCIVRHHAPRTAF
jgi:hypothetical protein